MSERKVLNKYYPPDFDPSKIPRMKLPRNRQYTVRLMAPFNMRCVTCGEYIYKGKKFNARKEDVEGEDYLGIRIYRFYIKCTRCLQEISFKTDPRNTDYEIEAGATRNFMALKLAEEQAQREEDERREDEATNPMKLLENRTKQSKQELELLESLEELRDLNRRQRSVDYDTMLAQFDDRDLQRQLEERQEEEDEKLIRSVFKSSSSKMKVIEEQIVDVDGPEEPPLKKQAISQELDHSNTVPPKTKLVPSNSSFTCVTKPSSTLSSTTPAKPSLTLSSTAPAKPDSASWNLSVGSMPAKKGALSSLVRVKKPTTNESDTTEKPTEKNGLSSITLTKSSSGPSGLSLLGSYSDSDSDGT